MHGVTGRTVTWHVPVTSPPQSSTPTFGERLGLSRGERVVVLRHDETGDARVYLDGRRMGAVGGASMRAGPVAVTFELGESVGVVVATVRIEPIDSWISHEAFRYTLDCVRRDDGSTTRISDVGTIHVPAPVRPPLVSIPEAKTVRGPEGDEIALYRVVSRTRGSPMPVTVWHRFSDFYALHRLLESAFASSHMALPPLPPRRVKALHSHIDSDFVHDRTRQLERYLQAVLVLPRAAQNPDLASFLGYIDPLDDVRWTPLTPKDATANNAKAASSRWIDAALSTRLSPEELAEAREGLSRGLFRATVRLISSSDVSAPPAMATAETVRRNLAGLLETNDVDILIRGLTLRARVSAEGQNIPENVITDFVQSQLSQLPSFLGEYLSATGNASGVVGQESNPSVPSALVPIPSGLDSRLLKSSTLFALRCSFVECGATPDRWTALYSSNRDGLSLSTIASSVIGYQGPTLLAVRDDEGFIVGALSTSTFEETSSFVASSGALVALSPTFAVLRVRGGGTKNHGQFLNMRSRTLPHGIGWGGPGVDSCRLWINEDFDECRAGSYDETYEVGSLRPGAPGESFRTNEVEIWGLGPPEALTARDASRAMHDRVELGQRKVNPRSFLDDFTKEHMLAETFKHRGQIQGGEGGT